MGFGVIALLAGCNQAFGLDPTLSIDAGGDFDHDGIFDVTDNCPTIANSDQANGDGDAFGDACDTCPTTPSASNHDEDGDFVGDACDAEAPSIVVASAAASTAPTSPPQSRRTRGDSGRSQRCRTVGGRRAGGYRALGSPRCRSATLLRLISLVPP